LVWLQVEKALDEITSDYEKVNHVISMYQDEKVRNLGLSQVGKIEGIVLELGIGPGNFTPRILDSLSGELVCFDYSKKMIKVAINRLKNREINFIRGVFEYLPFRNDVINLAVMSFSLRDSQKKGRVIYNVKKILKIKGTFLIIDIGKPNNILIMTLFSLYLKYIVPVISGLLTRRGPNNQWSLLHITYLKLPQNRILLTHLKNKFHKVHMQEFIFGGLIIALATKDAIE
jgi:demethylmenaquinone methyltransferase/2-methoxy-6-polyprenyl-1,4-benzoquinol methylase